MNVDADFVYKYKLESCVGVCHVLCRSSRSAATRLRAFKTEMR